MRILVFGKTGQVARELAMLRWPAEHTVTALGRAECDLADANAAGAAIRSAAPDVVINAAAYTAVDRAESESDLAFAVNAAAPAAMAAACAQSGAALLHLSTDYVFDGRKDGPYLESDPVNPLSVYGRTKEAGERAVRAALDRHIVLRTSWVFAGHGGNFVKTMLGLRERPLLRIVDDQKGCPTFAGDIARALQGIALALEQERGAWGTFHFSGTPATTWYRFAQAIFAAAGPESAPALKPITTAEYPTAATRPANSVLDCARIAQTFGIARPAWAEALPDVLAGLKQNK